MCFPSTVCNYTKEGRAKIHTTQKSVNPLILQWLMQNPIQGSSTEFNDNRISLYVGQYGRCSITGEPLVPGMMEVHHKVPISLGGSDKYENLTIILPDVHRLIHAKECETIEKYLYKLRNYKINFQRLNKLRREVGLSKLKNR